MPSFTEDHFSAHAQDYAKYRPTYPQSLFSYLAEAAPSQKLAWDVATGNGQAALKLAAYFSEVCASDASGEQIAHAPAHSKVRYVQAPAEAAPLEASSVDLVTVAQAAHWFDLDTFYSEVRRVLRPNGILAMWCYGLADIEPEIDAMVLAFYEKKVGPFWPEKRGHIDDSYANLPFPFEEHVMPRFEMRCTWSALDFLDYLRTWSAVKRFQADHRTDPVDNLQDELVKRWGNTPRTVRWPLVFKTARV